MKTRAFWGLGLTLAICAALAGCSSQQAKSAKASGPPPAVPVGVAMVQQSNFDIYLTGLGSVQAFNTVSLKTRIDGQIMQVNFQEGQDVKVGELLIVVDPRPYQVAALQQIYQTVVVIDDEQTIHWIHSAFSRACVR